jgi:hypothetical protein
MAHFAEINTDNIVVSVVTVSNEVLLSDGIENEELGIDLLESISGHRRWVQTSYNSNFRLNYAGIGYSYQKNLDRFIPPCPAEGYIFDDTTATWKNSLTN